MSSSFYSLLPQKEEVGQPEQIKDGFTRRAQALMSTRYLYMVLVSSLLLNLVQFVGSHLGISPAGTDPKSSYANLGRDLSTTFGRETPWGSKNRTTADTAWNLPDFYPNLLTVAVDVEWAKDRGLPSSQPWPWDDNKAIYSVNAMHLLHCVKVLRTTLYEYNDDKPLTWDFYHQHHCIDVLREDIMCSADDTLMYFGRLHGQADVEASVPGLNQERKCRDWQQLHNWVRERSACYWPIPPTSDNFSEVERYKFCPGEKKYWE